MNFESFFDKLLSFYKVKTVTDLADKLNVTRSTVQGWKNRQAIGTVLEFLFINDPTALIYIFSSNSNVYNLQNSKNHTVLDKSSNKEDNSNTHYGENLDIDKNILKLVDTVYSFAKENRLGELKTDLILLLQKYSSQV